jgi:hypothetical protein
VNATIGYRFPTGLARGASDAEVYLRGYRGPNPYGQLRNQPHFSFVGVGMKVQ